LHGGVAHVGVALALYLCAAMAAGFLMLQTYPHARLGLCNLMTLLRLVITAAMVVPLLGGGGVQWEIFALAAVALCLDGVDGWLARRQDLASKFGARFDMEVDAALGLLLALNAYATSTAGPVVLLLGLPRYFFAVAGQILPWFAQPLPDRFGRKVVCVIQIAVLIGIQMPIMPPTLATVAIIAAALALCWSFGRDVIWLWWRRA